MPIKTVNRRGDRLCHSFGTMLTENIDMGANKTLRRVLSGASDATIRFDDLCKLLLNFGFVMRVRGSHHVFRKAGIEEKINLQSEGSEAKPYQVRQVRNMILSNNLGEAE